ncbi:hypothetical protein CSKR_107536, partial [Clonorchis sinensis]
MERNVEWASFSCTYEKVAPQNNDLFRYPEPSGYRMAQIHGGFSLLLGLAGYQVKTIVSANVVLDDLMENRDDEQSEFVRMVGKVHIFQWRRASGLKVSAKVSEVRPFPEYEDVEHMSDNEMVLNAEPGTYAHKLKQPMMEVIRNYCR